MKKIKLGNGKPFVAVVGCLHGDEKIGKSVVGLMKDFVPEKGTVLLILANEKAMQQNKRFIDADLNRVFPGKNGGNHEEILATKILNELRGCDFVLDIHSTSSDTESFAIVTRNSKVNIDFAKSSGIKKIVFMEPVVASGKALIDHVKCGVSLEFNEKTSAENVRDLVFSCLRHAGCLPGKIRQSEPEFYSVYGVVKTSPENNQSKLKNFEKAIISGEKFYPVLFGEKSYTDILCLKAKKL